MTDVRTRAVESSAFDAEAPGMRARLIGGIVGLPTWAVATAGVIVIIVAWWIIALAFAPSGTGSIPAPPPVFAQVISDLGSPATWDAIVQTSSAAAIGYVWGNAIALLLAFIVLVLPISEGLATQLAVVASCIPLTALGPIVAMMSPAQTRVTSIFLAAMSVIFTTVVGALLGLRSASSTWCVPTAEAGSPNWSRCASSLQRRRCLPP